jgi:hypothetical protein
MHRLSPLSRYPGATLDALGATVAALLRYQDMLPTDLYVKLSLFRDDITEARNPSPRPSPMLTPHPAAQARPRPGAGTVT